MSEPERTIVVKHEIIKPKEPEKPLDKDEQEDAENLHELWFEDFKEDLAEKMPKLKDKILACEDGYQLEGVLQAEKDRKADDKQPYKAPKGKATLPTQPDYSKSLTQAESEADLINRLYNQAKDRDKTKQKIALEKIDKLYKSMVTNPKLGARVKEIPKTIRDFNPCPKCGAVVEANFNVKGVTCSECGFVSGQGSYLRKVY